MKAQPIKAQYHALPQVKLTLPGSELRMLLFAGDLLALFLASVAATRFEALLNFAVRPDLASRSSDSLWLIPLAIGWMIVAGITECYELQVASRRLPILLRVITATFVTVLMYLLVFFVLSRPAVLISVVANTTGGISVPPRVLALLFFMATLTLVSLWRVGHAQLFTHKTLRSRAVVIGCYQAGRSLVRALQQSGHSYEIVGFIDDDPEKQGQEFRRAQRDRHPAYAGEPRSIARDQRDHPRHHLRHAWRFAAGGYELL